MVPLRERQLLPIYPWSEGANVVPTYDLVLTSEPGSTWFETFNLKSSDRNTGGTIQEAPSVESYDEDLTLICLDGDVVNRDSVRSPSLIIWGQNAIPFSYLPLRRPRDDIDGIA